MKWILMFVFLGLGQGHARIFEPYQTNDKWSGKRIHYASTGGLLGAVVGMALMGNETKGATGGDALTALAIGAVLGGSAGTYLFYPQKRVLSDKYERILFPILDVFLGGLILGYGGAFLGAGLAPPTRTLGASLIGGAAGLALGSVTGGAVGYTLAVRF